MKYSLTGPGNNPDDTCKLCFETYSKDYLEKSWEWLNEQEIRHITNTPNFTKEEQAAWYQSLKHREDYLIWGISINKIKIGAVGLKHITAISAEFFTYIGVKEYWGKGLGKQIMSFAQQYSRDILHLKELTLKVLHDNIRAIRLYEKFGFFSEKKENIYIYMRKGIP
jgi:RimJ/RimL family protein N-acetyltransferase